MMNKKGQVLVSFIIIFPVIILALGFLLDFGHKLYLKTKVENEVATTYSYIKNNSLSLETLKKNLQTNLEEMEEIELTEAVDKVTIKLKVKSNGFLQKETLNFKFVYDKEW